MKNLKEFMIEQLKLLAEINQEVKGFDPEQVRKNIETMINLAQFIQECHQ